MGAIYHSGWEFSGSACSFSGVPPHFLLCCTAALPADAIGVLPGVHCRYRFSVLLAVSLHFSACLLWVCGYCLYRFLDCLLIYRLPAGCLYQITIPYIDYRLYGTPQVWNNISDLYYIYALLYNIPLSIYEPYMDFLYI